MRPGHILLLLPIAACIHFLVVGWRVGGVQQPQGVTMDALTCQVLLERIQNMQTQGAIATTNAERRCPEKRCPDPVVCLDKACPVCLCESCPSCPSCVCPTCPPVSIPQSVVASPTPTPPSMCNCKELQSRIETLSSKVDQMAAMVQTLTRKLVRSQQNAENARIECKDALGHCEGKGMTIMNALAAKEAPEQRLGIARSRSPRVNVAILTPQEGTPNPMTQMSLYTKEQYSRIHGYPFIMDPSPYAAQHGRHATWNRIPAVKKHLPHYDWILYMDSDIAIGNASVLLEDFIHHFPPDAHIAFTDGLEGFNAGGFFIRNTPWSYWLLSAWWNASEPNPGGTQVCQRQKDDSYKFSRCKFQWNDQVALWDAMLPYYQEKSGKPGKVTCKTSPSVQWQQSIACYRDTMLRLGYPYGHRSAFHFYFWALERDPRGWTFFKLDRRGLSVWPENELFHPGDFAIHTHDDKAVREYSIYQQMKDREILWTTRNNSGRGDMI